MLGFIFGLSRAYLLVLVPYMIWSAFNDKKDLYPEAVKSSWAVKMVEPAGDQLAAYLKAKAESLMAKKAAEKT